MVAEGQILSNEMFDKFVANLYNFIYYQVFRHIGLIIHRDDPVVYLSA